MKKTILFVVCIILSFFVGFFYNEQNKIAPTFTEVVYREENSLKNSIDKIYDAVVVIEIYDINGNKLGTGSGFCYKKENLGYIITNNHVVEEANVIKVTNNLNDTYEAKLIGKDEYLDIAVLTVPESAIISVAKLSTNNNIHLGDTVFTVGSPLGSKYRGTITKGIISGKDRKVSISTSNGNYIMEVLQTDAAINPGNSGGPLVNLNGEVIGVNSLKLVQDEIEGMGFAIPIELISENLEQLENGEIVIRPILGVEINDISQIVLNRYNIVGGIYINKVENNYPASKSGLQKGDLIIKVDNYEIEDSAYFRYILYKYKVGETIKITYIRNDKQYETNVLLNKGI